MSKWSCLALLFALIAHPLLAQQPDLGSRRKALNDLLAEQWEYTLRTNPARASILGDRRWNDKLNDFSQEFIDKNLEETKNFLARLEAIDTTGFPAQEALNKALIVRDLKMDVEGALPLDVLSDRIHEWVAAQKARALSGTATGGGVQNAARQ